MLFKTKVQELINQKLICLPPITSKAHIKKEFEYKGPPIQVQFLLLVVQSTVQYQNQGYHPGIPLAYHEALFSIVVAPQYAYIGALYIPFRVQYGQTSN